MFDWLVVTWHVSLIVHCCTCTNCWVCALQWASLHPSRKYPGSHSCDPGGVTTGCFMYNNVQVFMYAYLSTMLPSMMCHKGKYTSGFPVLTPTPPPWAFGSEGAPMKPDPSLDGKFSTFSAMSLELGGDRARGSPLNFKKYTCSDCVNKGIVKVNQNLLQRYEPG
jgi:hypothetical protein